jgi:hypothetical protein
MNLLATDTVPGVDRPAITAGLPSRRRARWRAVAIEALAVAALAAVIAAAAIRADVNRPLIGDEPFTYFLSKASGVSELFEVLSTGGFDSSPPLYVMAVWQAQRLTGNERLALRLPSSLGFVVMCLCLYGIARRSCPAPYAALALLTLPQTAAYNQATNARPYGLMLGFVGLALLSWQWAERGRWRPLALVGLATSLAAAVATHYFAILVLAPLALAEATRSIESPRRRIDVAVWAAFAFALAPIGPLWPLVAGSREITQGASWVRVDLAEVKWTYVRNLGPLLVPLLALGSLLLVKPSFAAPRPDGPPSRPIIPVRKSEVALFLGLMVIPILAIILGLVVTKGYSPRYVVFYIAGVALMLAFMATRMLEGRTSFGLAMAAIMLVSFLGTVGYRGTRNPDGQGECAVAARYAALAADAGRRLVILNGDTLIMFHCDLAPSVRKNLTLVDLTGDRHAKLYENLNRWLARKGLDTFDQRDAAWLESGSTPYYVYKDPVIELGLKPGRRQTIEYLGQDFYAVEPLTDSAGPITLAP